MVIVFAVLIAAAALLVVAYPIVRSSRMDLSSIGEGPAPGSPLIAASASRGEGEEPGGGYSQLGAQPNMERLEELLAERENAIQALRELSFDRQVGKLTAEDYAAFETNLKLTAAGTLRALDQWEMQADRALEAFENGDLAARTEAVRRGTIVCGSCGRASPASDRFCGACGAALTPAPAPPALADDPLRCPHCKRAAEPGDHFCAGCGKPLPQPANAL